MTAPKPAERMLRKPSDAPEIRRVYDRRHYDKLTPEKKAKRNADIRARRSADPYRGERQVRRGIVERCDRKENKRYHCYGGRGITICDRWRESFENFLADMGPRPPGTTIDRINNDGNYEPANCRWATMKEQSLNKRQNRILTFRGEALPLCVWARRMEISSSVVTGRLCAGWSTEDALTRPIRKVRRG